MIRHIVMLDFKAGFSEKENHDHAKAIKEQLEVLKAVIPGIIALDVMIDALPSSKKILCLTASLKMWMHWRLIKLTPHI